MFLVVGTVNQIKTGFQLLQLRVDRASAVNNQAFLLRGLFKSYAFLIFLETTLRRKQNNSKVERTPAELFK